MYSIKISYSWCDDEPMIGAYQSREEAYQEACLMTGKEAGAQNSESEPLNMRFNALENTIEMFYDTDDIYCRYSIEEIPTSEVRSSKATDCPEPFKNYAIKIEEKMSRTYIVQASSLEEALSVINDGAAEHISLDCEDFSGRTISPAEWSDNGLVPEGRDINFFPRYPRNTKISYLYRDASNYKVPNSVVVPGLYSKEQIDTIIKTLDERLYFIPHLVDFPEEKFEEETQDDHPWFELEETGFEETSEPVQLNISPEEVVHLFQKNKGKWCNTLL